MPIKSKKPLITRTIILNAVWNIGVMVSLYLLFNFFTLLILGYQLEESLDVRLRHEIEHFLNAFHIENNSIVLQNPKEFEEPDLTGLTDNPFFMQIYAMSGQILFRSANLEKFAPLPAIIPSQPADPFFDNLEIKGEALRVGYHRLYDEHEKLAGYIQLAAPKSSAKIITNNLIWFNLLTLPLVLVIMIIISIFLAKKSFAPINKIIDLANNISAANLSARLNYEANEQDELGRLRDTLNRLFARLQYQINQISQFTDNASHQLMSPLTVLKTELEFILRKDHENQSCRETLMIIKEQTERMIHIVKTMLILARDCADCSDNRTVFNLSRVIDEMKILFNNPRVHFQMTGNILLRGNKDYFALALENLIGNAVKYSEDNTDIFVKAQIQNSQVEITIEDYGMGISDDERQKIFERFYRGRNVQSDKIKGYGLGLSLVQSIVHSMGGAVTVEDNKPRGSRFVIWLNALQTS